MSSNIGFSYQNLDYNTLQRTELTIFLGVVLDSFELL